MTTNKSLKDKAIDIKWKDYVLVKDRVLYFNETYPNGSIVTQRIISEEPWIEIFKATITPDCSKPERFFTGYSQAKRWDWFINKQACLENAETSAVGRWLAFLGIWIVESIASADEIVKVWNYESTTKKAEPVKEKEASVDDNPNWRFKKAINSKKFMQDCMDEDDFIQKIRNKYTVDDVIETQLREAYKNVMHIDDGPVDLPFTD